VDPKDVTIDVLAKGMKLTGGQLTHLALNLDNGFHPTRKQRVGNRDREIDAPKKHVKARLRRLHRLLMRLTPAHRCAHGGARGKSCVTSARQHCGRRFIVTRDVKDCYPSILVDALKSRLRRLGFRSDVAWVLSLLLTVRGRVAQGSPVSSDALNLYLFDADRALSALAGTIGVASQGRMTTSLFPWTMRDIENHRATRCASRLMGMASRSTRKNCAAIRQSRS